MFSSCALVVQSTIVAPIRVSGSLPMPIVIWLCAWASAAVEAGPGPSPPTAIPAPAAILRNVRRVTWRPHWHLGGRAARSAVMERSPPPIRCRRDGSPSYGGDGLGLQVSRELGRDLGPALLHDHRVVVPEPPDAVQIDPGLATKHFVL